MLSAPSLGLTHPRIMEHFKGLATGVAGLLPPGTRLVARISLGGWVSEEGRGGGGGARKGGRKEEGVK